MRNFSAEAYEVPILEQRFLWRRMFIVNDPAGIKRIYLDNVENYTKTPVARRLLEPALGRGLLTMHGEEWRRHRRIVAPSFDHQNIVGNAPIMTEVAEDLAAAWGRLAPDATIDMVREMMQATLRIIARTMFSTEPDGIAEAIARSVQQYQKRMRPTALDLLGLSQWIPWRRKERAVQRGFGETNRAMERLIAERRAAPDIGRIDLLSRLIAARDEDGAPLTPKEIRDHVVTFFMAGHETTSVALSWTWYLLSQHPDAEAKLHHELDTVLGGRTPTYADIAALPYTRMVIEEAMRLYPPAHTMSRQSQGEDMIAGQRIRKGTVVLIVPWVLHRHRRLWDRPEVFEPERFAPDRVHQRQHPPYLAVRWLRSRNRQHPRTPAAGVGGETNFTRLLRRKPGPFRAGRKPIPSFGPCSGPR